MSVRHWLFSAVLLGASVSSLSLSVYAKDLAPNSADLQYSVSVPPMQISINQGGGGCVGVEKWDPTAGKCTETEYIKDTVRVVEVSPSPASVASDGTASKLSATVRDGLGRLAPAGVEVMWAASLGNLSTAKSITSANGIALASISSQVAGASTIYAKTTVSGNATTGVTFTASNPSITSISATPSEYRYGQTSFASYVSWSTLNTDASTTYRLNVNDARGGYVTGPTVFHPATGTSGWWLTTGPQQRKSNGQQDMPYFSSDIGMVTLTACNGENCTTASTTFSAVASDTGNGG